MAELCTKTEDLSNLSELEEGVPDLIFHYPFGFGIQVFGIAASVGQQKRCNFLVGVLVAPPHAQAAQEFEDIVLQLSHVAAQDIGIYPAAAQACRT